MREYILIAGPNGAGKSTIYDICPEFKGYEYINLDRFNKNGLISGARKAVSLIDDCFVSGKSLVQETTLCGRSILANISRAQNAGYRIIVHFIGLESPELAISRIKHRVAVGGHGIPDEDVIRRYSGSMERMKTILPDAEEVFFYDNTRVFVRVAKWVAGKEIWHKEKVPEWYAKMTPSCDILYYTKL